MTFPSDRPASALRLHCIPHAGGSAVAFRDWPARLGPGVQVVAMDPPGRGQRFSSPLLVRLDDVVADLSSLVDLADPAPIALFGHSMGAVVAYEMGRVLQGRGRPPVHVIVSGHQAPDLAGEHDPVHLLPDAELVEHLGRLDGLPAAVTADRELLEFVLPIVRADLAAVENHRHRQDPRATFPITALGGAEDRLVGREGLAGWGRLTDGAFRWAQLPGGHFCPEPALGSLFAQVRRSLGTTSIDWTVA